MYKTIRSFILIVPIISEQPTCKSAVSFIIFSAYLLVKIFGNLINFKSCLTYVGVFDGLARGFVHHVTVGDTGDRTLVKSHYILRQCAGFIREYVLDLTWKIYKASHEN